MFNNMINLAALAAIEAAEILANRPPRRRISEIFDPFADLSNVEFIRQLTEYLEDFNLGFSLKNQMEHSEESNDMILNHPDIESVENIKKNGEKETPKLENELKDGSKKEILIKITKEEALKKREDREKLKLEKEEHRKRRLEEKRLAEEEASTKREEKEKQKLENERLKQEYKERRLEEKRLAEEAAIKRRLEAAEEREKRKLAFEKLRVENKKRRLEEKRAAEEEALKKRKDYALKSMQYLLSVSTKYSDFFKEKITQKKESSNATKPLQERNKLQPTVNDMKEAVDVGKRKSNNKASKDVMKELKYFEGGELRQYQVEGVQWMVNLFDNGINGILADEMGLGKTVQVIALIAHLLQTKVAGPFLIVAPLSTIPNWEMEFARFAPQIPVIVFQGSEQERKCGYSSIKRKYKVGDFAARPVVLTTYQVPLLEQSFLNALEWQYIIIDEGHRIKNHESKLSVILRSLNSTNRLLLTGTPLHNNITELWALLNFLMPHIFNHVDTFASLLMLEDVQDENKLIEQEEKTNFLSTLHRVLEPFVLRRLKKDVLDDIVPKKELNIHCPLTKLQHDLYNYVIDRNIAMLKTGQIEEPLGPRRKKRRLNYYIPREEDDLPNYEDELLKAEELKVGKKIDKDQLKFISRLTMANTTMMFKKIVDHPYLVHFPLDPNTATNSLLITEDLIQSSGKMMVLDQVLARLKRDGHKVLIFSTLVMSLDLIEELFIMRGYKYCRLDGGMQREDRKENIASFNKDPDILAFLLSTRAGGLGLNLTGADTVIFFDRDWNPQVDIQAQDRCHRIGQTKPVMVYTLVAKNTIDELIINKGFQKRLLEKIVIKDGKFQTTNKLQATKIEDELRDLQKLLTEQATNFDDLTIPTHELDKLLDRSALWDQMKKQQNKL